MENENLPALSWMSVMLQWAFFFAIVGSLLLPAFRLSNLAKRHNKKGWIFFIIGLLVGIVGFNLGQLVVFPLRAYIVPEEYTSYLVFILLAPHTYFIDFHITVSKLILKNDK